VCASVDFVLNSIGLLWCNGSERQLRQGATKKRDNWRPAEVGDGTRDTRAKNRDVAKSGTGGNPTNDPTNSVKALKEDRVLRIRIKSHQVHPTMLQ